MDLILKVSERDGEKGKYKTFALVVSRETDHSEVVVSYDRDVICNVVDVSPARLKETPLGAYNLTRKEKR